MEIEKKEKGDSRIEFKVTIPWDVTKESLKEAYDKIEKSARIDGFRKGKIPRNILEERFSRNASRMAIENLVERATREIFLKENIKPLAGPLVNDIDFKDGNYLSFKIEVEIIPNFEIPDYKNIKISQKKIKIDNEEIEKHLLILQEEKAEIKEKEKRIEPGNIAVVDLILYPPSKKPIEHHGLYIKIGSSEFPKELEDNIIGMSKGEEKIFEIKMPEDTEDKSLAGCIIKIKVRILSVKEIILPKLDDDFAKRLNFENIKALKEKIKENLTKIEEEKEKENMKAQIIDELLKRTKFSPPESLVLNQYKNMLATFLYNLKVKNIPFERFLLEENKTEEEFYEELKKEAERRTKLILILEKIADIENIYISDMEYNEWVKENFKEESAREEALSHEKREILKADLRIEKTLDFLINK